MTLYELFRYEPRQIIEVEYLLDQCKRFGIEDTVQESFFQFSPNLIMDEEQQIPGFGEHEPWAIFHKRTITSDIIFFLIESQDYGDYTEEDLIREQVWNETFTHFVLKNDFRKMSVQEIKDKSKIMFDEWLKERNE
jgi:hypothetical protein